MAEKRAGIRVRYMKRKSDEESQAELCVIAATMLRATNDQLHKEVRSKSKEVAVLEGELRRLRESNEVTPKSKRMVEELQGTVGRLRVATKGAFAESNRLQCKIKELSDENKMLRDELKETKEKQDMSYGLRLEREIQEKDVKIKELEERIAAATIALSTSPPTTTV